MHKYYGLLAIIMMILASGCSSKTAKTIDVYTLTYQGHSTKNISTPKTDKVLKITLPQSSKEIQKNKILYANTPQQREAYAYSRWSDTPNQMIEQFLVSHLNHSGLFKAVIPNMSQVKPEWILESNIEDFYQNFDDKKKAFSIVNIQFFLINKKDKKLIARYHISVKVPSSSLDARGGVQAFNLALEKVAKELQMWLKKLL